MTTKVADVIVPEVFNPYVIERTAELSALVQSGIIETTNALLKIDETAAKGDSSACLAPASIGKRAPALVSIGLLMEANIETRQLN